MIRQHNKHTESRDDNSSSRNLIEYVFAGVGNWTADLSANWAITDFLNDLKFLSSPIMVERAKNWIWNLRL